MKRLWSVTISCLVLAGLLAGVGRVFAAATEPNATAKKPAQDKPLVEDPNKPETVVVARIGDYTINKAELRNRLLQEMAPGREHEAEPNRVVTVQAALDRMIAEKAMMIEGRKQGLLNDPNMRVFFQRDREDKLIQLMFSDYLTQNLVVTEADVKEAQKADPNMPADRAKALAQRKKMDVLLNQFYTPLLTKFKVQKVKENFQKASQIHQRILTQPAKPRSPGVTWFTANQIDQELTQQERDLPLATFEGGRLTLEKWLRVLDDMIPPNRPKNLNTAEGIEAFTDFALQGPVLIAEATARGYDKDKRYLDAVRAVEDNQLMWKVIGDAQSKITEPNDSQIKAYFEKNAARFGTPATIKIDEIWCADQATADEVKKQLAGGAAFDAVKNAKSLRKDEQAHDVTPVGEGVFWDELRKAEPNTVVGPMKGFFDPRVKWRVVKVLEKKPAALRPYDPASMKAYIQESEMIERGEVIRRDLEKRMLAKYPYEVYGDKIKDIQPLDVWVDNVPAR
jgi:hypothetical protein